MWPPVTYTEGIPDRKTLRIHSVYVQGVAFSQQGRRFNQSIAVPNALSPAAASEKRKQNIEIKNNDSHI